MFGLPVKPRQEADTPSIFITDYLVFTLLIVLTFCRNLPFLDSVPMPTALKTNSMVMSLVFIAIMLFRKRNFLFKEFLCSGIPLFVVYGAAYTLLISIIGKDAGKTLYGETPIEIAIISSFWLLFSIVITGYLAWFFKNGDLRRISLAFDLLLILTLTVGYIQVVSLGGFDLFSILNPFGWFLENINNRIATIGPEPSTNALIICTICLPYSISRYRATMQKRYLAGALMLIPLIFFISSSQCYIAFFCLLIGVMFTSRKRTVSKPAIVILSIISALCLLIAPFYLNRLDTSAILDKFQYYAFEKLSDSSNQSTAYRSSILENDIEVFFDRPLLGCGDGMQGFSYPENLNPEYLASGSLEIQAALVGEMGVIGAGPLIPGVLSSFGLFGMGLFVLSIVRISKKMLCNAFDQTGFRSFYLLALFAAFPNCCIGVAMHGSVEIYIILALSFLAYNKQLNTHGLEAR